MIVVTLIFCLSSTALRNANGQYYINGNFSIDYPQPFSVAGTTVHYERFQGDRKRNNAPEVLRALGPTSEPLFVVVGIQKGNHWSKYTTNNDHM